MYFFRNKVHLELTDFGRALKIFWALLDKSIQREREPTASREEFGGYNEAFVMQQWANYNPYR